MSTTLAQLRAGAQKLADYTADDDFIDKETWNGWINDAVKELHKLVVNANRDSYFATLDFELTTSNVYALPSDFYSIRGLTLNPDRSNRSTVHKFTFGDRNSFAGYAADAWAVPNYTPERRYRVVSRKQLIVEPKERSAGLYRLYYVPAPTSLAEPVTVNFNIAAADTPQVPPPGVLTGNGAWLLANATADATVPDSGFDLVLTFGSPNGEFSGTYPVTDVGHSPGLFGQPTFACDNLVSTSGYTPPASGTGTYTYQPVGTSNELDEALDSYAEYVKIVTAIKAQGKGEDNTNELVERRNVMRADIVGDVGVVENEPDTIVDVLGVS